jgi:hypothetical protein
MIMTVRRQSFLFAFIVPYRLNPSWIWLIYDMLVEERKIIIILIYGSRYSITLIYIVGSRCCFDWLIFFSYEKKKFTSKIGEHNKSLVLCAFREHQTLFRSYDPMVRHFGGFASVVYSMDHFRPGYDPMIPPIGESAPYRNRSIHHFFANAKNKAVWLRCCIFFLPLLPI